MHGIFFPSVLSVLCLSAVIIFMLEVSLNEKMPHNVGVPFCAFAAERNSCKMNVLCNTNGNIYIII